MRYKGEWKDDLPHGNGTFYGLKNLLTYKGSFVEGNREGYGILKSNAVRYEGEFSNNQFHGKGILEYKPQKVKFFGYFSKGYMEGRGI